MSEISAISQWALCMKLSHGIKSAMLDGKLRSGTSRTKKSHARLVEIALSVLEAGAFFLPSSMADFVPCGGIMERAHHIQLH